MGLLSSVIVFGLLICICTAIGGMLISLMTIITNTNFIHVVPPTQDAWAIATQKAKDYLTSKAFTNAEKVNLATGVGWRNGMKIQMRLIDPLTSILGLCVGNVPPIPRVNFSGLCLEDSPTGVRFAQNVSGFPAGINVAATWNRSLIYLLLII